MTKQKVLQMLREQADYCSGEALCQTLGVSRNAVWKAVNRLRQEGYHIDATTNKGYRLAQEQDLLTVEYILTGLQTVRLGRRIHLLTVTASTNAAARSAGEEAAGTVFLTEQQTAGRGKRGGRFYSPERGIYCSFLWRPTCVPSKLPTLREVLLQEWVSVLHEETDVAVRIQLPNELYVGARKLGGMLTEVRLEAESERIEELIIGLGIYCNNLKFPKGMPLTSLRQESGREVNRNYLIAALLNRAEQVLQRFE